MCIQHGHTETPTHTHSFTRIHACAPSGGAVHTGVCTADDTGASVLVRANPHAKALHRSAAQQATHFRSCQHASNDNDAKDNKNDCRKKRQAGAAAAATLQACTMRNVRSHKRVCGHCLHCGTAGGEEGEKRDTLLFLCLLPPGAKRRLCQNEAECERAHLHVHTRKGKVLYGGACGGWMWGWGWGQCMQCK